MLQPRLLCFSAHFWVALSAKVPIADIDCAVRFEGKIMASSKVKQLGLVGSSIIFVSLFISLFVYFGSSYGGFPPAPEVLPNILGSLLLTALTTIVLASLIEWSLQFYNEPTVQSFERD
jgi:hypothetical protein